MIIENPISESLEMFLHESGAQFTTPIPMIIFCLRIPTGKLFIFVSEPRNWIGSTDVLGIKKVDPAYTS